MAGKIKVVIDSKELKALYQTMTMAQLAEHYGCGETTIWNRIRQAGIEHEGYGHFGHRHAPREFTEIHRKRMSEARKGKYAAEANGNWKGGKTVEHLRIRGSKEYREWRIAALELRGNACQGCGAVDGRMCECCGTQVKLHVHHVLSFARFESKRFDPENSEVLCPKCHWSRHNGKIGRIAGNP